MSRSSSFNKRTECIKQLKNIIDNIIVNQKSGKNNISSNNNNNNNNNTIHNIEPVKKAITSLLQVASELPFNEIGDFKEYISLLEILLGPIFGLEYDLNPSRGFGQLRSLTVLGPILGFTEDFTFSGFSKDFFLFPSLFRDFVLETRGLTLSKKPINFWVHFEYLFTDFLSKLMTVASKIGQYFLFFSMNL